MRRLEISRDCSKTWERPQRRTTKTKRNPRLACRPETRADLWVQDMVYQTFRAWDQATWCSDLACTATLEAACNQTRTCQAQPAAPRAAWTRAATACASARRRIWNKDEQTHSTRRLHERAMFKRLRHTRQTHRLWRYRRRERTLGQQCKA